MKILILFDDPKRIHISTFLFLCVSVDSINSIYYKKKRNDVLLNMIDFLKRDCRAAKNKNFLIISTVFVIVFIIN
jgi:hypothetical protein